MNWKIIINDLSEEEKIKFVKQNGYAIKYIKYPSEKAQIEAVKNNGYNIRYINNPSKAVQLAAVKQNGYSIYYIKEPSEKIQIEAVKNLYDYDYNDDDYDNFAKTYIKSEKAKELYNKLKSAREIIK